MYFMFNTFFLDIRAAYDITWTHVVQPDRSETTIFVYGSEKIRFVRRIIKEKNTDTHAHNIVILIAVTQQQ